MVVGGGGGVFEARVYSRFGAYSNKVFNPVIENEGTTHNTNTIFYLTNLQGVLLQGVALPSLPPL